MTCKTMQKRQLAILFILLTAFTTSQGQILKVNKDHLNADSSGYWIGALSFNFNLNNRSVTADNENAYVGLNATTDVVYLSKKNAYISINDINYFTSSADDGAFISTGYSHIRANWLRKKRLSYENYLQLQYDKGRNMRIRFLLGGGLRYRLKDTKKTLIVVGVGAFNEAEVWDIPDTEDQSIEKQLWKSSNYLSGNFQLTKALNLNAIIYYQAGYDREDDLFRNRVNGDLQLGITISNRLAFLMSFSAQYEDEPIIDINKFIYQLKNGITYKF